MRDKRQIDDLTLAYLVGTREEKLNGVIYADRGKIACFNIQKRVSNVYIPESARTPASEFFSYSDGILIANNEVRVSFDVPSTLLVDGKYVPLTRMAFQCVNDNPPSGTNAVGEFYYIIDGGVAAGRNFPIKYIQTGSDEVSYFFPKREEVDSAINPRLYINIIANTICKFRFEYGSNYALCTEEGEIGKGENNVYVGDDGISIGENIVFTLDGHAKINSLDLADTAYFPISGSTKLMTSGAIKNALDGYVQKTGDAMTGDLSLKGENFPDTDSGTPYIRFIDSTDASWGYIDGFRNSGNTRGGLLLSGGYRGYHTSNQLGLLTENDGTPYVYIPSSAVQPWRVALGLGTSGALPITIDQGGSGQTNAISTNTVSDIATPGASNTTIASAGYAQWGKVAMVHLVFTRTVNTGTNTDVLLATIISGKRPKTTSMAVVRYTGANAVGYIESTGSVRLNTPTSIPSGTQIVIDATYILE